MNISDKIKYIGVDDTTLDLFESQYAVPDGVSLGGAVPALADGRAGRGGGGYPGDPWPAAPGAGKTAHVGDHPGAACTGAACPVCRLGGGWHVLRHL